MGSNGSRDTAKENEEAEATATTPSPFGSRRSRAGFSDSFSSQGNNFMLFFFSRQQAMLVCMNIELGVVLIMLGFLSL